MNPYISFNISTALCSDCAMAPNFWELMYSFEFKAKGLGYAQRGIFHESERKISLGFLKLAFITCVITHYNCKFRFRLCHQNSKFQENSWLIYSNDKNNLMNFLIG